MVTWGVVTSKNEHSTDLLWERGAEKHEAQGQIKPTAMWLYYDV
jgi:hypothetical protein